MRLRVFEDLCPKAGVNPADYGRAFSTMLAGEASEFYYQKLASKDLRYQEMVRIVRSNFETVERRNKILN